jgi:multidrug efflux pump subunit AcrB
MSGPITWFIKNPIAANLLMVLLIIGGYTSIPKLDKQFFPTPEINQIEIRMEFRGASPREVEEQISVRIEEAIMTLTVLRSFDRPRERGSVLFLSKSKLITQLRS